MKDPKRIIRPIKKPITEPVLPRKGIPWANSCDASRVHITSEVQPILCLLICCLFRIAPCQYAFQSSSSVSIAVYSDDLGFATI